MKYFEWNMWYISSIINHKFLENQQNWEIKAKYYWFCLKGTKFKEHSNSNSVNNSHKCIIKISLTYSLFQPQFTPIFMYHNVFNLISLLQENSLITILKTAFQL